MGRYVRPRPPEVAAFGAEVRRRRKAAGLTLEQLAERADLSPNYLASVELGKKDPTMAVVHRIARALGATASELLGARPIGERGREAAMLFDRCSREWQGVLLRLLIELRPMESKRPAPPRGKRGQVASGAPEG